MKTLVTMGRGGTGKTSFVALQTKFFVERNETPLLLVDVDPDQIAVRVVIENDALGDLAAIDTRALRKVDVQRVSVAMVAELHGLNPRSGKAL